MSSPPFSNGCESSRVEGSGVEHARQSPSNTERTWSGVISLDELRSALRRCCVKTPVTKSFDLTSVFEHMVKTDMLHENREKESMNSAHNIFSSVAKVQKKTPKVPYNFAGRACCW